MPDEHDEDVEEIERELERRMRDLHLHAEDDSEKDRIPEPPNDEEIERRMEEMRGKVASAGGTRMPDPPELKFERPKSFRPDEADHQNYRGLGVGITAAYALVGMMVFGFGIGWLLDHGPSSSGAGPAFGGLIGAALGIAFVLWMVSRSSR